MKIKYWHKWCKSCLYIGWAVFFYLLSVTQRSSLLLSYQNGRPQCDSYSTRPGVTRALCRSCLWGRAHLSELFLTTTLQINHNRRYQPLFVIIALVSGWNRVYLIEYSLCTPLFVRIWWAMREQLLLVTEYGRTLDWTRDEFSIARLTPAKCFRRWSIVLSF